MEHLKSTKNATDEIEKKYIVTGRFKMPIDAKFEKIKQGYICLEPVVRIRKSDDKYTLTIKGPGDVSRTEVEKSITKEEFDALWSLTDDRVVEKTRYFVPFGKHTIEFDIFEGKLGELVLFEVEFKSLKEAENFDPGGIDWIMSFEDVSEDQKYKNNNLAINGL